jgi:hypothetical protein
VDGLAWGAFDVTGGTSAWVDISIVLSPDRTGGVADSRCGVVWGRSSSHRGSGVERAGFATTGDASSGGVEEVGGARIVRAATTSGGAGFFPGRPL